MRGAAAAALSLLALTAGADDQVVLAGTEWSRLGSYTYAGIISPLGEASPGNGLVMRHWLERLTYEYDSSGQEFDAERYGYAPALGYQTALWGGYAGIYGGIRLAHTDLSPDDPGNKDEGNTARFFLQADAVTPISAVVENQVVAGFETRYSGYYLRDRLQIQIGQGLTAGPEAVLKGGEDYDGWQAGLSLGGLTPWPGLVLTLRGGISGQSDEDNTGYAGIEFVTTF